MIRQIRFVINVKSSTSTGAKKEGSFIGKKGQAVNLVHYCFESSNLFSPSLRSASGFALYNQGRSEASVYYYKGGGG